jgi:hypothetical protein
MHYDYDYDNDKKQDTKSVLKFENGASTSPIWKNKSKTYVITLNFFSSFYSYLGISN